MELFARATLVCLVVFVAALQGISYEGLPQETAVRGPQSPSMSLERQALTIDDMIVNPGGPAVGWGSAFLLTAVVSGGTPPYSYSWTQIAGSPVAISGADTTSIVGLTPKRAENLSAHDRTRWQVTGWNQGENSIEFWLVVTDGLMASVAQSGVVNMVPLASASHGFVGLGTEVVVNGADQSQYSWSLTSPGGSVSVLMNHLTQAPYFVPDFAGTFVVTENNTAETVSVYVDSWVGVGTVDAGIPSFPQCALCHSSEEMEWRYTPHARTFEERYTSFEGDPKCQCMPSHTVGYNDELSAVNDGYDDMVDWFMNISAVEPYDCGRDSICPSDPGYPGPDPDGTEGDGLPDLPLAFTDLPIEVKNMTGVQCGNCHGPFVSGHYDGNYLTPAGHLAWESSVCGTCHSKEAEWLESGHSNHVSTEAVTSAPCVQCHTGNYFVDIQIDGNPVPTADPDNGEDIACATCHDPHMYFDWDSEPSTDEHQLRAWGSVTLPNGTVLSGSGSGAICIMCHSGWSTVQQMDDQIVNGAVDFGPHHGVQGYMMAGEMGYEYSGETYTDSYHATSLEDQCVTCHLAPTPGFDNLNPNYDPLEPGHGLIGGHTLNMSTTVAGKRQGGDIQNFANGCNRIECHSGLTTFDRLADEDFDGDGTISGVQTEIRGLLNALGQRLPPYFSNTVSGELDDNNSTVEERRAAWNWYYVVRDRSFGIHNTDYSVELLQTAIANTPDPPANLVIFVDGFESGGTTMWSVTVP